jgi:hypothetical protein
MVAPAIGVRPVGVSSYTTPDRLTPVKAGVAEKPDAGGVVGVGDVGNGVALSHAHVKDTSVIATMTRMVFSCAPSTGEAGRRAGCKIAIGAPARLRRFPAISQVFHRGPS